VETTQKRVPKPGDLVFVSGLTGSHVVTAVNPDRETVNAETVAEPLIVTLGVAWGLLIYPDEVTDQPSR
jgi:hypothetical protein